jgi:hypothetical protein
MLRIAGTLGFCARSEAEKRLQFTTIDKPGFTPHCKKYRSVQNFPLNRSILVSILLGIEDGRSSPGRPSDRREETA